MSDKYLVDVISFERDIEPYRVIEIISGVGSGKSTWVEEVLMGESRRVLLITSRKAKVEETANRTGLAPRIVLNKLKAQEVKDMWGTVFDYNGSVVVNNWQIESFLKNRYDPKNPKTFLWNYFDFIVVDEVHSLATDATFADASFHLLTFLKESFSKNKNVKFILLTATPDPVKNLSSIFPESERKQCRNLLPSSVDLVPFETVLRFIKHRYNVGDQIVYFAARTKSIYNKIIPRLTEMGIPEAEIAVSFSNEDDVEKFSPIIRQNRTRTDDSIKYNEVIPPDIRVFISTSKNKEGINIKNDSVTAIFAESHWKDELQQIWGRVRTGIQKFVVITDAEQHPTHSTKEFPYILSKKCLPVINESFMEYALTKNATLECVNAYLNKDLKAAIEYAEDEFSYVRFNIFSNKFELYSGRIKGEQSYRISQSKFDSIVEDWNHPDTYFALNEWFFGIPTMLYTMRSKQEIVDEYIKENNYLNAVLTAEEQQEAVRFLSQNGIRTQDGKPYRSLGKLLSNFGYKLIPKSKKAGKTEKVLVRSEE